ncbi:S-layer homology domain-containing protein [Paenibacillus camerounensis]|uniref:S-layer homology domain-containing protein n=1 Tax=Paenibacillus camerounensis TaxID=1243663 RepID=UPI0006935E3A|nr:S-layer homology domain-containing protein [Paenibacillus camerounensis]
MNKRIFRACIAWIIFSLLVLPFGSAGVSADAALTASLEVDHNTAAIKVTSTANEQDTVTVLIMQKQTGSIAYMNQAELKNGQHTFQTVLPKGEYCGSVSSAGSGKAELQAFTVEHTETITGFRPLQAITVAKGGKLVLPGSVIAVFDSGANREVGVKWSGVPDTGTAGQFTVTGNVNGSLQTVELVVKVGGTAATPTPTPTSTPAPTASPAATAPPVPGGQPGAAATPKPSLSADSSAITLTAVLDPGTAVAKAEVSAAAVSTALSKAAADARGIRTVEIIVTQAEGAKAYEPVLPASLFAGDLKQVIRLVTPVGTAELSGNMFETALTAGNSTVSVVIGLADAAAINDPSLRESASGKPVIELTAKVDGAAIEWSSKNAPVKVSVPYTPKQDELNGSEHIVVWYIDPAGKTAKIPNTRYDAAAGRVTFSTTHFSKFAVSYASKTFADAAKYTWAQQSIEALASKGVINGISDTSFAPEADITRADFLVILVRGLGLTASFSDNFSDVSPAKYYYEALGMARERGITDGAGNNLFKPDTPISRQELMVLGSRALSLSGASIQAGSADDILKFSDRAKLAAYAVEDVAAMVKEGIVSGSGSRLNPHANATRAEAAVIVYRIMNKL